MFDQAEDSLSTKNSRIIGGGSQMLGSRRNQRGILLVRQVRHFIQVRHLKHFRPFRQVRQVRQVLFL